MMTNLFKSMQDVGSQSNANLSSSYAISNLGEKTDLSQGLTVQPDSGAGVLSDETTGLEAVGDEAAGDEESAGRDNHGDKDSKEERGDDQVESEESKSEADDGPNSNEVNQNNLEEYSAEPRTYHAFFDKVTIIRGSAVH